MAHVQQARKWLRLEGRKDALCDGPYPGCRVWRGGAGAAWGETLLESFVDGDCDDVDNARGWQAEGPYSELEFRWEKPELRERW